MPFLLDSDTFIEAKDDFYGFDFCPAYWDFLVRENQADQVFSIERVRQELSAGNDELVEWAKTQGAAFFLPMDAATVEALKKVSNHVQKLPATFDAKKRLFLNGADPVLIAHALAHGQTIVTREVSAPNVTSKIKIPNLCHDFGVPIMRPCEMLRQLKARFVLES